LHRLWGLPARILPLASTTCLHGDPRIALPSTITSGQQVAIDRQMRATRIGGKLEEVVGDML
jgi:hypothetical protein